MAGFIPAGPRRGAFRLLNGYYRRLANRCVIKARVDTWDEAALMAADTFPLLEEMHIERAEYGPNVPLFLEISAPQLTQLTRLECDSGSVPMAPALEVCRALPQLKHLKLLYVGGTVRLRTEPPLTSPLFQALAQLKHLTTLILEVCGGGARKGLDPGRSGSCSEWCEPAYLSDPCYVDSEPFCEVSMGDFMLTIHHCCRCVSPQPLLVVGVRTSHDPQLSPAAFWSLPVCQILPGINQ